MQREISVPSNEALFANLQTDGRESGAGDAPKTSYLATLWSRASEDDPEGTGNYEGRRGESPPPSSDDGVNSQNRNFPSRRVQIDFDRSWLPGKLLAGPRGMGG